MTNNPVALPKSLIIFAICIPIALLVGYLLATPSEFLSFGVVGLVLLVLSIPLFLRWHHPMLIFAWNTNLTVFFLPGQPSLWMVAAALSLFLTILACVMERQIAFQNVRSITWPLLFLVGVILVTAKLTGGIGVRSFGAETYGGKKFFFVLGAIIGYFALSSRPIPIQKAQRYTGLFFLSGLTAAVSNLIYLAGPSFYFLFLFFSVDNALSQAMEDFSGVASSVHFGRVQGVTVAAMAGFCFMLSRYGIRGVLDLVKPWRWIFLLICLALSLLGGFRSAVILLALICVGQFYFERLFRTRLLLVLLMFLVFGGVGLVYFSKKLPLSVQRSLSFLPIEIDLIAQEDAQGTLDWRLEMWRALLPQVREYFFLGKGYALNPTDLYLAEESVRRGLASGYESNIVNGDYHSGPLSVIIPFGIFGLAGFVWLLAAGTRVLYRNHRFSNARLQHINTFLLSYFVARSLFYFVGFGSFYSDLPFFLGVLGFSVALNGGVCNEAPVRTAAQAHAAGLIEPETA